MGPPEQTDRRPNPEMAYCKIKQFPSFIFLLLRASNLFHVTAVASNTDFDDDVNVRKLAAELYSVHEQ